MALVIEEQGLKVWPCVSFLLVDNGRVLLESRRLDKPSDPGGIAIPGGHMEAAETPLQTLHREMHEELGVTALEAWFLCTLHHPTSIELQRIHYYVVPAWQGRITAHEAASVNFYPLSAPLPLTVESDTVAVGEYLRVGAQVSGVTLEPQSAV